MADNQTDTTAPDDETNKQVEFDSKINAVVKSHLRRELKSLQDQLAPLKSLDKLIADAIEKAGAKAPAEDKGATEGKGAKVDPQVKLAMERMEKLEKQLQEEQSRRVDLELKAKKGSLRAQLKDLLEAKGVKGARNRALIADWEQSGIIVEGEDGSIGFKSTRSRSKGAAPETLEFDLVSGIEDWAKSPEAAEFLPAPSSKPTPAPAAAPGQRRISTAKAPANGADLPDEALSRRVRDQLDAQGVNWKAILEE